MIDVRTETAQALVGNADLVALLGGKNIYQIRAPDANQFPRITFFEMGNANSDFADDKPIASEIQMQIDIWCMFDQVANVPVMMKEVDKALTGAGFVLTTTSPDLLEPDGIFHKGLRYKIKKVVSNDG